MEPTTRYLGIRAVTAAGLTALALVLALPAAYAEVLRTGSEPWYQQSTVDAQQRAQALFAQAVDKHQQLLRGEAKELYEQALALWDNPDIRWNLALVLDDLGQYVRAHQQLEGALRWDMALGTERLREVQDRMRALETQRLARIEAYSQEAGAAINLDGQPWFRGPGRQSMLVLPGTHYLGSTKAGYIPATVSMVVAVGEQVRVTLRMAVDHLIETRRWSVRKPWGMVAAGIAVAVVGAGLEWRAFAHRDAAANLLASHCNTPPCVSTGPPDIYDRATTENQLAIGAVVAGGTTLAVGLALAWLNQPRAHRPEAPPSPIELIPAVSPGRAGVSALIRF
jgi:tetratricopeptide (TPR) repeat protein